MAKKTQKKTEDSKELESPLEKETQQEPEKKKTEEKGEKVPFLIIATIAIVIVVGLVLLFLPKGTTEVTEKPLTNEDISNVAFEATRVIIQTAERNIGYNIDGNHGVVRKTENGYIVSFPISGSDMFSEFVVSLDGNMNLMEVGYSEDALANPQAFFAVVSLSNEQLRECGSMYLRDEIIKNWINKFNETFPTPGKALIFRPSRYMNCSSIIFPYSVSIGDGNASVTVLNNITVSAAFEKGKIVRGFDIPFGEIDRGVEIQVGRSSKENETDKLVYIYRLIQ